MDKYKRGSSECAAMKTGGQEKAVCQEKPSPNKIFVGKGVWGSEEEIRY